MARSRLGLGDPTAGATGAGIPNVIGQSFALSAENHSGIPCDLWLHLAPRARACRDETCNNARCPIDQKTNPDWKTMGLSSERGACCSTACILSRRPRLSRPRLRRPRCVPRCVAFHVYVYLCGISLVYRSIYISMYTCVYAYTQTYVRRCRLPV
jgi:hypothetical protein